MPITKQTAQNRPDRTKKAVEHMNPQSLGAGAGVGMDIPCQKQFTDSDILAGSSSPSHKLVQHLLNQGLVRLHVRIDHGGPSSTELLVL